MPTEQEIKQHYEQAPTKIKELLSSELTADEVRLIAKRNQLDLTLTEVLFNEVGLVLLGFEEKASFAKNLEEVLEINEQRARAVGAQIDETIFSKAGLTESTKPTHTASPAIVGVATESQKKMPMQQVLQKPTQQTSPLETKTPAIAEEKNSLPVQTPSLLPTKPEPHEIEELKKDLMPLRVPGQTHAPLETQPRVSFIGNTPQPEEKKEPPKPFIQATPVQKQTPQTSQKPLHQETNNARPTITYPTQKPLSTPTPITKAQQIPQPPQQEKTPQENPQSTGILGNLRESSKKMSIKNIIASLEE
jgi:hypothetical protein